MQRQYKATGINDDIRDWCRAEMSPIATDLRHRQVNHLQTDGLFNKTVASLRWAKTFIGVGDDGNLKSRIEQFGLDPHFLLKIQYDSGEVENVPLIDVPWVGIGKITVA